MKHRSPAGIERGAGLAPPAVLLALLSAILVVQMMLALGGRPAACAETATPGKSHLMAAS